MKFLDVPQSGSIADRTHSHNRAGQYTRNRRSPVQPIGTGRRAFIRSAFGASSAAWASLSGANQEAWISFAADHPITDALGQSVILTGHQMFVAVATNLQNVGEPLPTTPPSDLSIPSLAGATVTIGVAGGVAIEGIAAASGKFMTVAFSKPQGTGRRFTKTFWQPHDADGFVDLASGEYALTTAKYVAEFGTFTSGQVIFVKMTPLSSDGWAGSPSIVRVVTVV